MNFKQNHPAQKQEKHPSVSFTLDTNAQNRSDPNLEWAQIAPNKVVVATSDRAWLLQPDDARYLPLNPSLRYLSQSMEGTGSVATTRQLLDGAIGAAKYAVNSDVRPPALTATRWVWRLASQYHLTHSAPQIMEEAAKRFEEAGRSDLAEWATAEVIEERGHDLLALRDIQSLEYDAEAVVKTLVPPATAFLMDYVNRSVQDSDPIDCVGYSYTMERLALGVDERYVQKVETLLPKDTQATCCLRVHSSIGADAVHVEETLEMIAGLTSSERTRIARACYETALICFSPPSAYISNKELQQILEPLKLDTSL